MTKGRCTYKIWIWRLEISREERNKVTVRIFGWRGHQKLWNSAVWADCWKISKSYFFLLPSIKVRKTTVLVTFPTGSHACDKHSLVLKILLKILFLGQDAVIHWQGHHMGCCLKLLLHDDNCYVIVFFGKVATASCCFLKRGMCLLKLTEGISRLQYFGWGMIVLMTLLILVGSFRRLYMSAVTRMDSVSVWKSQSHRF